MPWQVEFTDAFGAWFEACSEAVQDDVDRTVRLLEERRPNLPHSHSSGVNGSAYDHMHEFRIQSGGRAVRVFYALDPRWIAILLLGGDKTGDDRSYETLVPQAGRLYALYLEEIRRGGLIS